MLLSDIKVQDVKLNKFLGDDTVFNAVQKNFISLQDDDVTRVNKYLHQVLVALIERMKRNDTLFKKMYQQIIFCGSFYKGTKVGRPNEFDLNFILQLPLNYCYINFYSTQPAFIRIHVEDNVDMYNNKYKGLSNQEKRSFHKLMNCGYLNPDKLRHWTESVIRKVINELQEHDDKYELPLINETVFDDESEVSRTYIPYALIKVKKSGPAFTVILDLPDETENICIDVAPALTFHIEHIKQFTTQFEILQNCRNNMWFAIPVPLSISDCTEIVNLHWRLSFCLQEHEILGKYGRVKPVIRQMKKLRDTQKWKSIASYYIETLFLNKLPEFKNNLDKLPLTLFFFIMLNELLHACKQHELAYFWNTRHNLFEKIGKVHMSNICHRLRNIINDIEANIQTNSLQLAKYILEVHEYELLTTELSALDVAEDIRETDVKEQYKLTQDSRCIIW